MSGLMRWRLATPLIILSSLCLAAVTLGARLYWSLDDTTEHFLTILLTVMFTTNLLVSVSIGIDRRLQGTPWLRLGVVIVIFALSCGVAVLRENV